ncbi:glycerophosphodiester phosphodiesterase family protein [Erysipelothrix urinaevulpis]|uniref:glycerophosphodiester phosphodiesterase family protein n=1 Tax=Erysipelothrix urinaevulpis TaxID=2683717 RepID=UPI00135BCBF0|nr:glycerophosphodiester phosphodiesterase family protein [Erysipelothrix urinaevulpis]
MLKIIIIIILVYVLLIKPPFRKRHVKGLFTHRGHHDENNIVLENSLAAFEKSCQKGYGIELDVQLSKDDVVYVFHDGDFVRLLGNNDKLSDLNSWEIDLMTINGHTIPRFSEVLECVAGRVPLIVELKPLGDYKRLATKTVEQLDDYEGEFVVESFDPRIVFWFRLHRRNYTRGQLIMQEKEYDVRFVPYLWIHLWINVLTRPDFMAVHKNLFPLSINLKLYQAMGGNIVSWTIHEKDPQFENVDAMIFEYFEPKTQ